MEGEQKLWRAVILQAFVDMAYSGSRQEMLYCKRDAAEWLTHRGKGLSRACFLAEIHIDDVLARAHKVLMDGGLHWRLPAGEAPDYEKGRLRKLKRKIHLNRDSFINSMVAYYECIDGRT